MTTVQTKKKPTTALVKPKDTFRSLIEAISPEVNRVIPKHCDPGRLAKLVLVEASKNPKLYECSSSSVAACVMLSAELGLEPGSQMGHLYLIPRRGKGGQECTALIGYKGLAELARRSGKIARVNAGVFYQQELDQGLFSATREPPRIQHQWVPDINMADDQLRGAYATVELKDGSKVQTVLTRAEIEKRLGKSSAGNSGPWSTDFAAMCRKTALRALLTGGLVPLSTELSRAIQIEHEDDGDIIDVVPEPKHASSSSTEVKALLGV